MSQNPRGKSVAFIVLNEWKPTSWSIDLGLYVRAFVREGHRACVICPRLAGDMPKDYPVHVVPEEKMSDPAFWKEQDIDIALVMTWLWLGSKVMSALRVSGPDRYLISKGDSDGLEGMRIHPQSQITRMWFLNQTTPARLRGMWTLLKKYLLTHRNEDALLIQNLRAADLTTLESESARQEFLRFVDAHPLTDVRDRVQVMVTPIEQEFLTDEITERTSPHILAVARWDDPQKDAPLLVETLRRYLTRHPASKVTLIGGGGDAFFAPLCTDFPQVRYLGRVPHNEMLAHFRDARILFFSSRWEGAPIAANEALALGGSVVGPNIPGLHSIANAGPYGTVSEKRTADSLATALATEMQAWEKGERVPAKTAAYWRPQFDAGNIARRILQLAEAKSKAN